MKQSEIAFRYATALFELSEAEKSQDLVFSELRCLKEIFSKDLEISTFLTSPIYENTEREKALSMSLQEKGLSELTLSFVLLLARRGRFLFFDQIVEAFQGKADDCHSVIRGEVESASILSTEQRKAMEAKVSSVTGKRVILSYKEESNVIGGVVARVGSYTFDDSLESHLDRLKDEIRRSTH